MTANIIAALSLGVLLGVLFGPLIWESWSLTHQSVRNRRRPSLKLFEPHRLSPKRYQDGMTSPEVFPLALLYVTPQTMAGWDGIAYLHMIDASARTADMFHYDLEFGAAGTWAVLVVEPTNRHLILCHPYNLHTIENWKPQQPVETDA